MTEKRKPQAHWFKPGQSGNPGGRYKLPPELRALSAMSRNELKMLFTKYLRMSAPELLKTAEEVIKEGKPLPVVDMVIISGLCQAIQKGDWTNFEKLLDRTIGKVKDEIDFNMQRTVNVINKLDGSKLELTSGPIEKEEDSDEVS